ncbi:MAG: hypothetical protein MUF29_01190 [Chitinophagaceae bacterium]|nr:hypothetical protein [Chitinophagaceae bacterium]
MKVNSSARWGTLWVVIFLFLLGHTAWSQQPDKFAEIGNKAAATRVHLLQPQPAPVLPEKTLPLQKGGGKRFLPMNRMDTPAELDSALQQQRLHYAPFLEDHAPPLASTRDTLSLTRFQWRVATAADRQDFAGVLSGKGAWDTVQVPHYGPPLGKAITYYRTQFNLTAAQLGKGALYACFRAVDYKAHVFVNGTLAGSHEGAFAPFEFDISALVRSGSNTLLVQVENDYPMLAHVGDDGRKFDGDKVYAATGIGYDDPVLGWHHNPPGMGIWQPVQIEARHPLHIHDIYVRPLADSDTAEVWLEVNQARVAWQGLKVRHALYGQNFRDTVYRNAIYVPATVHVPGVGDLVKPTDWEAKTLKMGPGVNFLKFRIHLPAARRWSPHHPWLYQLQIELLNENGEITDAGRQQFGMRSFRMDTLQSPKGAMYLNGQFIRLRGANTMGAFTQSVKNGQWQQLIDDILLAKIANLNYIRLTQFPLQREVYEYFDKLGMLAQTDLPIFGVLRRNQWAECIRQAVEMERLVRSHPSNIMVSYINERFPNAEGNPQRHLDTYEDFDRFFTAADQAVLLHNPDRVIKAGDGDYDPPSPGLPDNHVYNGWYNGHGLGLGEMYKGAWLPVKPGWYYACGEFGSEGLDFQNTMQRYYPKSWLPAGTAGEKNWTPNVISMAQSFRFHYMWYPRQYSVEGWISESHRHQAWVTRTTTEAFRRNNNLVSFAIHLFIDAWPAGWMKTIMDVQRQPKPAYFEYAHALAPVALSLRADRSTYYAGDPVRVEAWIANDLASAPAGWRLRYQWEAGSQLLASGEGAAGIEKNQAKFQGYIDMPAPAVRHRTNCLLRMQLIDEQGTVRHETDFSITVFPPVTEQWQPVWVAPESKGEAAMLVRELNLPVADKIEQASVLLVDDMQYWLKHREQLETLVQQGKTLVLLRPDAGSHLVCGDTLTVQRTTMGQYYFAAPVKDHPAMRAFQPRDIWWWYNSREGMVRPLLGEMSTGKGWTPLVTTGQTGWVGANDYALAAAERSWGKGQVRVCHLQLAGRVTHNPMAREMLKVLMRVKR